jgi:hypothetical protein
MMISTVRKIEEFLMNEGFTGNLEKGMIRDVEDCIETVTLRGNQVHYLCNDDELDGTENLCIPVSLNVVDILKATILSYKPKEVAPIQSAFNAFLALPSAAVYNKLLAEMGVYRQNYTDSPLHVRSLMSKDFTLESYNCFSRINASSKTKQYFRFYPNADYFQYRKECLEKGGVFTKVVTYANSDQLLSKLDELIDI